jgi:hypothetical protein
MVFRNILYAMAAAAFALMPIGLSAQTDTTKKNAQNAAAAAAVALLNAPEEKVEPPKPVYWTKSVLTNIQFSQTKFDNWAAGGIDNVTLASYIDANANYAKDKKFWNNRLQLDYGFIYQDDKPFVQKNTDRIYLESKYGHRMTDKLNYSGQFTFLSQFTNSYNYQTPNNYTGDKPSRDDWMDARTLKSGFLSPAYFTVGIGIDWVPNPKNNWLVVNFAPLTGGLTLVTDESLRMGYGMSRKSKYKDETNYPYSITDTSGNVIGYHGEYYKAAKWQLGAQLKVDLNLKINTNITYSSQLVLFSDYLDNPQNLRVNWDNRFNWLLAKYFTFSLTTFLIYDDNVLIKDDSDIEEYPDGRKRIQFKELIGFGFTYTFPSAKK